MTTEAAAPGRRPAEQKVRGKLRRRLPDRVRNGLGGLYGLVGYAVVALIVIGLAFLLGGVKKIGLTGQSPFIVGGGNLAIAVIGYAAVRGIRTRATWGYLVSLLVGAAAIVIGVGVVAWIAAGKSGVSGNNAFLVDVVAAFYLLLGLVIVVNLLRSLGWARRLNIAADVATAEQVVEIIGGPSEELGPVELSTEADGHGAATPLVTVRNLKKHFPIYGGILKRQVGTVYAVDGVSFDIFPGEVFSLVGESGCGKTTLGRTLLQLTPPTSGKVVFDGFELEDVDPDDMRPLRRRMQIIFQDPFGSLNPRMPVSDLIGEGLLAQGMTNRKARDKKVEDSLEVVGLRRDYTRRYPHEFSGGQRQRIGVARALALGPDFIVCDEPVSALDVSIQSQILNLLLDLRRDFNLTYLFISHNLSVVQYFSDRVGVMYLGRIVEIGKVEDLYRNPRHPYTVALLSAIPLADPRRRTKRLVLKGDVPSPAAPPSGCRFHTRCWLYEQLGKPERCVTDDPALRVIEGTTHQAACHFSEEISEAAVRTTVAEQDVVETAAAVTE